MDARFSLIITGPIVKPCMASDALAPFVTRPSAAISSHGIGYLLLDNYVPCNVCMSSLFRVEKMPSLA